MRLTAVALLALAGALLLAPAGARAQEGLHRLDPIAVDIQWHDQSANTYTDASASAVLFGCASAAECLRGGGESSMSLPARSGAGSYVVRIAHARAIYPQARAAGSGARVSATYATPSAHGFWLSVRSVSVESAESYRYASSATATTTTTVHGDPIRLERPLSLEGAGSAATQIQWITQLVIGFGPEDFGGMFSLVEVETLIECDGCTFEDPGYARPDDGLIASSAPSANAQLGAMDAYQVGPVNPDPGLAGVPGLGVMAETAETVSPGLGGLVWAFCFWAGAIIAFGALLQRTQNLVIASIAGLAVLGLGAAPGVEVVHAGWIVALGFVAAAAVVIRHSFQT